MRLHPHNTLLEQELIAHVFASPAGDANEEIGALWTRCRTELDLSEPAPAGRSSAFPPDGPAVGVHDRAMNHRLVARNDGGSLAVSLIFATPPAGRVRIGSASPPGWAEFARWWSQLKAGPPGTALGVCLVFQAKRRPGTDRESAGPEARAALPPAGDDPKCDDPAGGWRHPVEIGPGIVAWDISSGKDTAGRRLVVLAEPGREPALNTLTWGSDDSVLPPLARYLMHAARLRHASRTRGDGRRLAALRRRMETTADRIRPGEDAAALAGDEAALVGIQADLRRTRRTVRIAGEGLRAALPEPFPADEALLRWLEARLAEDSDSLEATRERAAGLRELTGAAAPPPVPDAPPPGTPADDDPGGLMLEARGLVAEVVGWQLAAPRWQLVERTLQVALDAAAASDGNALGFALGELGLLGPVRRGRVGGNPTLPCPPPVHARAQRLAGALRAWDR